MEACVEPGAGVGRERAGVMAPAVGVARRSFASMSADTALRIVDRDGEAVVGGVRVG